MQRRLSPYALTVTWAALAAAATLGVAFLPFLRFAYRAPSLHVALETANALVALLLAYLIYGRFRQSGRLQELLLVGALGFVAVANLPLTAIPEAVAADENLSEWAPLGVRLVGTVSLAVAAMVPRVVVRDRQGATRTVLLVLLVVGVLGLIGLRLGENLPPALDPDTDLRSAYRPAIVGHPVVLGVQVLSGVLYALAAVAFTRQAARRDDELLRWLGAACALGAFARVNYFLFPSLYSDYVYTGDVLRAGFYVLLLIGAAREIGSFWAARTQAAVLEDRRRMARDLHDGLTQELTYIWSQTRLLQSRPADRRLAEQIGGAAGRALDEARYAIAALTRPADEPFATMLEQLVEEMASRYDADGVADVEPSIEVTPERREAILRITGEAFRNAVRHGGANRVTVGLASSPLELVVRDDGRGFDPADAAGGGGFGLTSMRERAEGAGGELVVESAPGKGAVVRVRWP